MDKWRLLCLPSTTPRPGVLLSHLVFATTTTYAIHIGHFGHGFYVDVKPTVVLGPLVAVQLTRAEKLFFFFELLYRFDFFFIQQQHQTQGITMGKPIFSSA